MHDYTREDILRLVEEEDVAFIRLQFTDIFGNMKNMAGEGRQLVQNIEKKGRAPRGGLPFSLQRKPDSQSVPALSAAFSALFSMGVTGPSFSVNQAVTSRMTGA